MLNLFPQILSELDSVSVEQFQTALDDDFNTAAALAVLFELAKLLKREFYLRYYCEPHELSDIQLFQRSQTLIQLAQVVGLEVQQSLARFEIDVDWVESRIQQRQQARQARQYAESDHIRDELQAMGITLIDQSGGLTRWYRT
jgi:cysteinyl-tRNA synthetase